MNTDQKEVELSVEVSLVEEETAVYVRIHGFENLEDADLYADYLANNLPLMLFNSEVKH
jgi:hypothetical protein